ncbi:MAG: NAD-binding protein [Firmicutes bacterium]|nr:NAD-binding protein [Bacillota bacterium]
MSKVGFVGLGIMGKPMCKHMLEAGIDLTVTDLNKALVDEMVSLGAKSAGYEEMAKACDIVMMILPNASISRSVIEEMKPFLAPGKIVVDMSSVTPGDSKACYESLKEVGVKFVDSPISGGENGAIAGTLAIMCGGDQDAFDALEFVFKAIGSSWLLIGGPGAGSVCKLVNQAIVNINLCAVGESLTFAEKAGVDPMKVFEAIKGGLAGSEVLRTKAPMMCERNFVPGGTILVNRKDVKNVLATAHEIECPMPFTAQVYEVQNALVVDGHLKDDQSSYVTFFERLAGVTVHTGGENA